ncbi:hypothetical protein [Paenibacillus mucilaginosus]|uniref:hypothetical protein n=1 Tax=Paenibacillus mucilaginosus TaxID=61624 RepID=UPI003D1BE4BB
MKEDVVQEAQIFIGEYAQRDAELAFLAHTNVYYELFLQSEDRELALSVSDTVGSHIRSIEVPAKVVIEVSGGVAEATQVPHGVEVQIIDWDNVYADAGAGGGGVL